DGNLVKGWILEPKTPGPHPVLIWNRGGAGPTGDISFGTSISSALYQKELAAYASAGYVVVCTQYRGNGNVVNNPSSPPDIKSGNDNFIPNQGKDSFGGAEVNDVINLLPLIQKMNESPGNGGLKINLDLNRVAMMGQSRGGMETYISVRELSDKVKFGTLPQIKTAIVKGGITHLPKWFQDRYMGILPAFTTGNSQNWGLASKYIAGNSTNTSNITSFFPADGPFPVWNNADLRLDQWMESNFSSPPSQPYDQVYSEDYYARSAALWQNFWKNNTIPFLILHGVGDTQVRLDDPQLLYNNILAFGGNSSLYTLKLFPDSPENTDATAYLGTDANKLAMTDHWLVNYDYGHGETLPWLAD
ncbi:MAG: hypothetical protein C0407_19095, partial [Desulfobacca sp.]|nr:hypothetical protein [Desulfobacca sp.]